MRRFSLALMVCASSLVASKSSFGAVLTRLDFVPTAISDDGSVVVGYQVDSSNNERAVRWTQAGGTEQLMDLTGSLATRAEDVSDDGSVIVGVAVVSPFIGTVFRWTAETGVQSLIENNGKPAEFRRPKVSGDGRVVAMSRAAELHRWTAEGGPQLVGGLGAGNTVTATGLSYNGSVVLATRSFQGVFDAFQDSFLWSSTEGFRRVEHSAADYNPVALTISREGTRLAGMSQGFASSQVWTWEDTTRTTVLNDPPGHNWSLQVAIRGATMLIGGRSIFGLPDSNYIWDLHYGDRHLGAVFREDFGLTDQELDVIRTVKFDLAADGLSLLVQSGSGASREYYLVRFNESNIGRFGDLDGDNLRSNLDIFPFVLALTDPSAYRAAYPQIDVAYVADVNRDGAVNNLDIRAFGLLMTGAASVPEPSTLSLVAIAPLLLICRFGSRGAIVV